MLTLTVMFAAQIDLDQSIRQSMVISEASLENYDAVH